MKPNDRKNLASTTILLVMTAFQSTAIAAPTALYEGFKLESNFNSGLNPWLDPGGRWNYELFNYSGGIVISSGLAESAHGKTDGGLTVFGKPVSFVLGTNDGTGGTFAVWDETDYYNGSTYYFPAFKIDTTANTAVFNGVNVSVTNGSLSVAGNLNLTGTTGTGISLNGTSVFSLDSAGKVNYASTRPVAIASTTAANSTATTGALTVAGGIGVAKDSFINGLRIGRGAGDLNTNAIFGSNNLTGANTGGGMVAFGINALAANTSGYSNTALGAYTLTANTTGLHNTAVGASALYTMNAGSYNTAVGVNALSDGVGIHYNTAVGTNSLRKNTSNNNAAFGNGSLLENTTGTNNAGLGTNALWGNVNGWNNVGVGTSAGYNSSSGSGNVFLGFSAGRYLGSGTTSLTTTSNSIYIGYDVRGYSNLDTNSIVIGASAVGEGANTTVIGNTSTLKTRLHGETNVKSLKVAEKTTLEGQVIIAVPQGDILMGDYQ